ncbi:MAG: hypothetical protein ACI976_000001, partial [Aureispira sp.]
YACICRGRSGAQAISSVALGGGRKGKWYTSSEASI